MQETDSKQVPRGKDEKHFEKRVIIVLETARRISVGNCCSAHGSCLPILSLPRTRESQDLALGTFDGCWWASDPWAPVNHALRSPPKVRSCASGSVLEGSGHERHPTPQGAGLAAHERCAVG